MMFSIFVDKGHDAGLIDMLLPVAIVGFNKEIFLSAPSCRDGACHLFALSVLPFVVGQKGDIVIGGKILESVVT